MTDDDQILTEYGELIGRKYGVLQPGPTGSILTTEWANLLPHIIQQKCNVYEQITHVVMDILHWEEFDPRTILTASNLCGVLATVSVYWQIQVLRDHEAYLLQHGDSYPAWDALVAEIRKARSRRG